MQTAELIEICEGLSSRSRWRNIQRAGLPAVVQRLAGAERQNLSIFRLVSRLTIISQRSPLRFWIPYESSCLEFCIWLSRQSFWMAEIPNRQRDFVQYGNLKLTSGHENRIAKMESSSLWDLYVHSSHELTSVL
jgi:hypothetical protein